MGIYQTRLITPFQPHSAKPEDKKLILGNGLSVVITKTGHKIFLSLLPEGLSCHLLHKSYTSVLDP
jgi:hypothetical protein